MEVFGLRRHFLHDVQRGKLLKLGQGILSSLELDRGRLPYICDKSQSALPQFHFQAPAREGKKS